MRRVLVPMMLLPLVASATTYTQTDWSGGPGVPGPVEAWGSAFQQETHVCWSTPGQIGLDTNYIEQSFTTAVPILSGQGSPTAICSSDFNGDGLEDIAGGFWSTGRIYVVLNPGAGPWQPIVVDGAAPEPVMLSAADFDGDGDSDLAVSESGADRISWYQNSGSGTAWLKRTVGTCPDAYSCVAWDPDLDGDGDILCTSRAGGWVGWFENAGGAGTSWILHVIDDAIQNPITAVTGDFDGNPGPDLAVAGTGGIRLAVYTSPGYGRTVVETDELGCTFYGLEAADLSGDGRDDIVGGSVIAPEIDCYLSTASPSEWSFVQVTALASSCIEARDLDSDGDLDIVSSSAVDTGLLLRLNNGAGSSWSPKPILPIGTDGFFGMAQGDFDGDGAGDLAGSSYSGQALVTMLWGDRAILYTTGSLASSILHLGASSGEPWFVRVEGNTYLTMRFRASDDPGQMGSWSGELLILPGYWEPLAGYVDPGDEYVQYLVSPAQNEEFGDPVVTSVAISDDITGIWGDAGPASTVTPVSNPAAGSISIRIVTSGEGSATIDLYDISGRLVETVHPWVPGAGEHVITGGGNLPPGCYTVRYSLDGREGTLRVVLLR